MNYTIIDRRQNSAKTLRAICDDEAAQLSASQRAVYEASIAAGDNPQFAIGLATRRSAMMKGGDRIFNEGAREKMNRMPEVNRDRVCAIAQRAGINTAGKYYVSGLGRYSDPRAWVSTAEDVKTVCKEKNLNATGFINHKATELPPPPKVAMADDLVQEKVTEIVASEPKTRERLKNGKLKLGDVRERVVATHSRQRSR